MHKDTHIQIRIRFSLFSAKWIFKHTRDCEEMNLLDANHLHTIIFFSNEVLCKVSKFQTYENMFSESQKSFF